MNIGQVDIKQLCVDLELATKRSRGQPLAMDTKLKIVGELLQQRQEREASGKRRTTINQTGIAKRYGVAHQHRRK